MLNNNKYGSALARSAQLLGVSIVFGIWASAASAHGNRIGGQPDHDPVTGYVCVSTNCTVIRMPDAYCICQKVNPGEQRLSLLRLACYTKSEGSWVSCPVKPRYGIPAN